MAVSHPRVADFFVRIFSLNINVHVSAEMNCQIAVQQFCININNRSHPRQLKLS